MKQQYFRIYTAAGFVPCNEAMFVFWYGNGCGRRV